MKAENDNYDWLEIGPKVRKQNRKKRESTVKPIAKLTRERKRAPSMAKSPFGRNRIWACDGEFVWFRPKRNGVVVANPLSYERHQQFLDAGHYQHVETQDDVEVYRLTDLSPFKRKGMYLGEMNENDVFLQAGRSAVNRDWVTYVDTLEELSTRYKSKHTAGFAATLYGEMLTRLELFIAQAGGPSPAECAAGLANIQGRRGRSKGKVILTPMMSEEHRV